MTSKHLFCKVMKEDMRQKIWMAALSILANMMAILVAFLIFEDSYAGNLDWNVVNKAAYIKHVVGFFHTELLVTGGIVAIAGAVIVGLFGFRFLYSKRMVDTYHSLPIKRNTQFWSIYINGFLLWAIPFLVSVCFTGLIAVGKLLRVSGWADCVTLISNCAGTVLVLTVAFLLVYHVILVAVMISGNVWNVLLTCCVLGFGPIAIYGLSYAFYEYYMDAFYAVSTTMEKAVYTSPLFSSIYLMFVKAGEVHINYTRVLCINILVTVILLAAAFVLYKRRASELAEQGVKSKVATYYMRLICGLIAGMSGWMVFILLTGRYDVAWGIFGCIFCTVLAFGVLSIVFHMDFKAFFADKIWMGCVTVLSLFVCFAFTWDWFGYDTYLPAKEKIKEMGIYCSGYSNHYAYQDDDNGPIEQVKIQDQDMIYAFLEEAIANMNTGDEYNYYEEIAGRYSRMDRVWTKVTLKNGRTYYRSYRMYTEDKDVFLPILESEEYILKVNSISDEVKKDIYMFSIRTDNVNYDTSETKAEIIGDLVDAYNQDLVQNPRGVAFGEGRLLARITMIPRDHRNYQLDVYECMSNTIRVLEEYGYSNAVRVFEAEEVESIQLKLDNVRMYSADGRALDTDYEFRARRQYQIWDEESLKRFEEYWSEIERIQNESYNTVKTTPIAEEVQIYATKEWDEEEEIVLTITDKREIAELLELLHYESAYNSGVFQPQFISDIIITDNNGNYWKALIKEGDLPMKFIERFASMDPAK